MDKIRFFLGKTLKFCGLFLKAVFIRVFFFDRITLRSLFIGIEFSSRLKPIGPGARIVIGKGFYLRKFSDVECHNGEVIIGDRVFINKNCTIVATQRVKIGNDCMFGEDVSIYDHDHRFSLDGPFRDQGFVSDPVSIGNNVWVGCKVFIGKGVSIGNNVIIGANSVVTKDIPDGMIAYGNPARYRPNTEAGRRISTK